LDFHSVVEIAILVSLAYYCLVQFGLTAGVLRLKKGSNRATPLVSVIVAARNEQNTIGELLESLVNQTYPNYEIIIVNDRSTDATGDIVHSFQESNSNIVLVTIDTVSTAMPPKKNALTQGIRASKGGILCFTDADCIPPRTWVASLISQFESNVGVVAGYSPYDTDMLHLENRPTLGQRILFAFVAGEELKGAIWSAGSIGLDLAWLCTGRNFSYRRTVFDDVGGFDPIKMSVSGDDDLFIQLVRRRTSWKIRFATSEKSLVPTAPPPTFRQFVEQRTRHFSAGKYFTAPMKAFFFLFHGANLLLLVGAFAFLFAPPVTGLGVLAFLGKLIVDAVLTVTGISILREERPFSHFRFFNFLLTEILYIFYNTFIGPLGLLTTFEWKADKKP
jgi:cellulose synthase/poly-beta-1,6-N-acetylglucosamine synthase-like glycosyltransferase